MDRGSGTLITKTVGKRGEASIESFHTHLEGLLYSSSKEVCFQETMTQLRKLVINVAV